LEEGEGTKKSEKNGEKRLAGSKRKARQHEIDPNPKKRMGVS